MAFSIQMRTQGSSASALRRPSFSYNSHHRDRRLLFPKLNQWSLRSSSSKRGTAGCLVPCAAAAGEPPARALRKILESPGIHLGPACYDALSARLVERAGFGYCFMSGFSVSAARLALPDAGLISYGEIVDQGYQITQAVSIPVIGDGDNGYGNHMNVKRTVKGFIKADFAGIILEDQMLPKACGHTQGRKVVSMEESLMRIKAALDARRESGSDIVIIARTDSRQAESFEESLRRSRAYADAGADVLFIDALASREEMKAFCEISPLLPKMANMLEGGGKTPILNPTELEEIGFKLVSYPLSLIGVSIRAMEDALDAIKGGCLPSSGSLPSFEEIKRIVGFNDYYEEEKRYTVDAEVSYGRVYTPVNTDISSTRMTTQAEQVAQKLSKPTVEVITPYVRDHDSEGQKGGQSGIRSCALRVKITGRDGIDKLDVRIPAGFLEGLSEIVPGLGGVNIKDLLGGTSEGGPDPERGKVLLDINDTMGDRIQVILE